MSPSLLFLPSARVLHSPPPLQRWFASSRVSFPTRARRTRLVCAADSNGAASSGSGGDATASQNNNSLPKNRRDILLEYVNNVHPEFMELFVKRAPAQVFICFFSLLLSPHVSLKCQFSDICCNELLEYLKTLEPQNLKELTSTAGEDVVFAMNVFIKRLLAVSDPSQMKTTVSETSANQLANLLFWLMIVGYSIRSIEVRFDMERVLGAPPKIAELPPGEKM
ncbi:uncharacterized protein LOC133920746 [Phragmites australis]|uniref:uncharacterized protein LOC133920746 n=1 Tax=Phragmites australis TaxID=29695 RepID=UPI002D787FA9|nr:uncharacterized protein LOC133920746 [Phragmites australis]